MESALTDWDLDRDWGLSRREWQVVALVASGSSNREIGHALVVTERTAETYVSRILRKLGLASRTQLAVWALDRQARLRDRN